MRPAELNNVTETLDMDEKCYGVVDADMTTDDYMAVHRYRLTYVIRDDKRACHVLDLTDAGWYSQLEVRPPAQLVSVGEDSVGDCWNLIEERVYGRDNAMLRLRELKEQSAKDKNIIHEFLKRNEMAATFIKRNRRSADAVAKDMKDGG